MYFPPAKGKQSLQHFKRALFATLCQADGVAIKLDTESSQGMYTYGRVGRGFLVQLVPVYDGLILNESV
jgi:hypothetical protein